MIEPDYKFDETFISNYEKYGHVSIGKFLTDEFCDRLVSDIERNSDNRDDIVSTPKLDYIERTLHLARYCEAPNELLANSRFSEIVAKLMQVKQVRFWHDQSQSKLPTVGSWNKTHQDIEFLPFYKPYISSTAWVALDDVTVENGCMHMIRGSHKWGVATDFLNDIVDIEKFPKEYNGNKLIKDYIELKKGEIHFHHHITWHGSYRNKSQNFRRAYIVHFFEDGTRFDELGPYANGSKDIKHKEIISTSYTPLIGPGFELCYE